MPYDERAEWIRLTMPILGIVNWQVDAPTLPDRRITDDMLYHLFATGLCESVEIKWAYNQVYERFDRPRQQRYVQERDRLEIRKLRAELEVAKAKEERR